jgi:hypothetical protein
MLDRRTLLAGLGSSLFAGSAFARVGKPSRFEVHEWGTFTSVASGATSGLEWRPLAGKDDLPSFVHRLEIPGGKGGLVAKVRMETPVLYFYAPKKMSVNVAVDFPEGSITEWYPAAATQDGSRLEWSATLDPDLTETYAREPGESHYYPARQTASTPLEAGGQREKLLFYRGAGKFDVPVRVRGGAATTLDSIATARGIEHVISFVREGDRISFGHLDRIDGDVAPFLAARPGTLTDLEALLGRILTGSGLFEDEARAMIATWQDDWFEEGMRLFYLYPRSATDRVLPLRITPEPEVLVRTLVGRLEVLTPAFRAKVLALAKQLGEPDRAEAARAELAKNRFAHCVLQTVDTPEAKLFLATDRI